MSMKIRFILRAEPSPADQKTTVTHLYAMQLLDADDDTVYEFPEQYRNLSHHESLFALPIPAMAKRDLTPRWRTRAFKVTLPETVAKLYTDLEGNAIFQGRILDELVETLAPTVSSHKSTTSTESPTPRPLTSIIKDAVIPKFGSKNFSSNAEAWLQMFESECQRLSIPKDRYWEIIRLFLEDSAENSTTMLRYCLMLDLSLDSVRLMD
ncbi:hypothetical protein PGB90_009462 [Kerria lacca]